MPTQTDWDNLSKNTTSGWTTINGVTGRFFKGSNGNSIFLPATGYRNGVRLNDAGNAGCYYSSSLYPNVVTINNAIKGPDCAYYFRFNNGSVKPQEIIFRFNGLPVRPVRPVPPVK